MDGVIEMKYLIILLSLLLSGCAFVSKDIHPKLTHRTAPLIEIRKHSNWFGVQAACFKQNYYIPHIYMGCSLVPINPKDWCIINVIEGGKVSLQHELKHCHGYADTIFPWKAQ